MLFFSHIKNLYFKEYPRWIHFLPIGLISGILYYFIRRNEPQWLEIVLIIILGLFALLFIWLRPNYRLWLYLILGFSLGFLRIIYHVHNHPTFMIVKPQKNVNVKGTINSIENCAFKPGFHRLVLSKVTLNDKPKQGLIRVNLASIYVPKINIHSIIELKADLYPLPLPACKSAFNPRLLGYLKGLTASGTAKEFIRVSAQPLQTIEKLRYIITKKLQLALSVPYSGIATALVTGDKSYIPNDLRQNFADSGLAHILVIAGLHLSIISGLVFFWVRRLFCLSPAVALKQPIKKYAAIVTILFSAFYMSLADYAVPIERAFMMVTISMLAILINRTAISVRSIVIACVVVIMIDPGSVISASFQLSFGTVLGLLAFYETLWPKIQSFMIQNIKISYFKKKILLGLIGVFSTTLVATLASSPFTIYFFKRYTLQSVLGNLLAVPWTSIAVMPCGLITMLLMPFNLEKYPAWCWEQTLIILCKIATFVAGLPGAAILVPAIPSNYFYIFWLGFCALCILRTKLRLLGIFLMLVGCVGWYFHQPIKAYISASGDLMAFYSDSKMMVSKDPKNKYVLDQWREEWGAKSIDIWPHTFLVLNYNHKKLALMSSTKNDLIDLQEEVKKFKKGKNDLSNIFITRADMDQIFKILPKNFDCLVFDKQYLWRNAGVYIYQSNFSKNGFSVNGLKRYFGYRPWCPWYRNYPLQFLPYSISQLLKTKRPFSIYLKK